MNVLQLADNDAAFLSEWSNQHMEEMRQAKDVPCVWRDVEISYPNGNAIRFIRDGDKVQVHFKEDGKTLDKTKIIFDRTINDWAMQDCKLQRNVVVDAIRVYTYAMFYISSDKPVIETTELTVSQSQKGKRRKQYNKKPTKIMRFKHISKSTSTVKRKSPEGVFTVRGHYRHLATGKRIWVREYKNGTGKKLNSTYKL